MKQLTCEMCGSTELLKQDGVFTCQTCGTKYSVEEAKKMMVEGNVKVNAKNVTIVSNTEDFEVIFNNAKLLLGENAKEGIALCNKALGIQPANYEVWALKAKFSIGLFNRKTTINSLNKIKELTPNDKLSSVSDDVMRYFISYRERFAMVRQQAYKDLADDYLLLDCLSIECSIESADSILGLLNSLKTINMYDIYVEERVEKVRERRNISWEKADDNLKSKFEEKYAEIEAELDKMLEEFEKTTNIQSSPTSSNSGGCYVATAVYGSYDCPQVWTLRRYRDYTLAETWYGRAFIKTYYAISPTLVKWFGHTEWFKKMWQGKLDRMVAKLQANGVESTPYEDKKW